MPKVLETKLKRKAEIPKKNSQANFLTDRPLRNLQKEAILGMRLCTLHNLYYFQRLMSEMRTAIEKKRLESFSRAFFENTKPR